MKKIVILALALVLLLTCVACTSKARTTQLGTSDFTIVLPRGYELAKDEMDEDQVAYYRKNDKSIDFDVYQWAKDDQYTLVAEAAYYAAAYGAVPEVVTINGISGMKYVSAEEFEGNTYTVVNYMFEDDTSIVEICFWTVGNADEYAAVDEIIGTLKLN